MTSDPRLFRCLLCSDGAVQTVYFPAADFPKETLGFEVGLCDEHGARRHRARALHAARSFRAIMRRAFAVDQEEAA